MPPAPPPTSAPRIAVIGGGITGLAAAHRLRELLPAADVHLFEAGPRLGGILETVHRDGFLIERSADNFLTRSPVALDLCHRLGIAEELLRIHGTNRRALVVRNGRPLAVPEEFYLLAPRRLAPMLKSPILSPAGKLRLLLEPLVPPRRVFSRVASDAPEAEISVADESVASFARRRLGREVFERLVQPLVAGIYTADPERLSMAATMPDFLRQEQTAGRLTNFRFLPRRRVAATPESAGPRYALFTTPRAGMSAFVTALADRLPAETLHVNAPVTRLSKHGEARWRLGFGSPFDAVLLAIPAHAAARLLGACDRDLAAQLGAIDHASSAVVSLGFRRDAVAHPLDGMGLVVPRVERRRIIAASFASLKFPGRAPEGHVLIRTFLGGALQPELVERSDDELRQIALEELGDLLGITGPPIVSDVARWHRAMPQYHVGHLARVARIERLAARHPTLALAGNAYHGVGIPQCIASAESAVHRLAETFAAT